MIARALADIGGLFGSEQVAERQPKPEVPYTKQDFDQSLSLVSKPVNLALLEIGTNPDPAKARSAAGKLGPAASALRVMAGSKREASNQANMLAPLADIQAAQTTLQVLGDFVNAHDIWTEAFQTAMQAIDAALALPVVDPDAAKDADNADAPPADAVQQRDHDLMESSLKPTMQRLIARTAGAPFADFDPMTYTEGNETLAALGAFSIAKLAPAKTAVTRGVQAITAFSQDVDKSLAEATARLEAAQQKLAQSASSYFESDPHDPSSPSYVAPEAP
jgi:hypothetical protein